MSGATLDVDHIGVQLRHHAGGVYLLKLKPDGDKPFIFSLDNVAALESVAAAIESSHDVRALVIHSGHPTVFSAGADVEVIARIQDRSEAQRLSRRGQDLFNRFADFHFPTVAAVHGTCIGGGLEFALTCAAVIVSDHPDTRLGLPEVKLGILPAWGGTTRLPKIVGLPNALDLIVSGRTLDGPRAVRMGLARACVPHGLLLDYGLKEARERIFALEHGDHGGGSLRSVSVIDYFAEETRWGKKLVINRARAKVAKSAGARFPAPREIIDTIGLSFGKSRDEGLWREREAVGRLVETREARHLASLFLRNRDKVRGRPYDAKPANGKPIQHVAVIGAGVMGSGIAALLLESGIDVRLIDAMPEALARARGAIEADLAGSRAKRDSYALGRIMARLTLAAEVGGIEHKDLIIEAVPEIPSLKDEVLDRISRAASADALIATNTSSLGLHAMEAAVQGAARFAGFHFFNPARKMPLIEIVRSKSTSEETLIRLIRFARRIGKVPVVVEDKPAFVVNRLLAPYMVDALRLLSEGETVPEIDAAMRGFGFPIGPFEVMDTVGIDVVRHVCAYLATVPDRGIMVHPVIERMAARKRLGRKTGSGFYFYDSGKAKPWSFDEIVEGDDHGRPLRVAGGRPGRERIVSRLLGAMTNEARRILDEGAVSSADDLDLASIFGIGFPPETGGIATWMREKDGGA